VEPHGLAPASLGEEEERALLAPPAQEGGAERHHEPHEAWPHLMRLGAAHWHGGTARPPRRARGSGRTRGRWRARRGRVVRGAPAARRAGAAGRIPPRRRRQTRRRAASAGLRLVPGGGE